MYLMIFRIPFSSNLKLPFTASEVCVKWPVTTTLKPLKDHLDMIRKTRRLEPEILRKCWKLGPMAIIKFVKSYQIINPSVQLFSSPFLPCFKIKYPTSFPVSHEQSCVQRSFCSEPRRVDEVEVLSNLISSWKVMELLQNAQNLKFPNDNARICSNSV